MNNKTLEGLAEITKTHIKKTERELKGAIYKKIVGAIKMQNKEKIEIKEENGTYNANEGYFSNYIVSLT